MDADERAILNAIIEHPDEDTPRLVYADWLQEHDRPERAEYIRLSIELANLRYGAPDFEERYQRLRAARDPLIAQCYRAWERTFSTRFPANKDTHFLFQRGFVESIRCSVKYFLDNAEALFREAPLRTFWPNSLSPTTAKRLVSNQHFARLCGVRLFRTAEALALLGCESIRVRALDFSQIPGLTSGYWDNVAATLTAHEGIMSVKYIDFENCGLGNLAGACLADARHIEPEVLNLLGSNLEDRVKQALRIRFGTRVWLEQADRVGTRLGKLF